MLKHSIEDAVQQVLENAGYFVRQVEVIDEGLTLEKNMIESGHEQKPIRLVIRALKK